MRLLIVDDDIPTTQVVRDCVLKMGLPIAETQIAHNVVTAKAMLEQQAFDIVICDIEMPRYTGIDLLEWVRAQGGKQEFIFLTCHENFSYAAQAIRYKAEAYIIKPVNYDALRAALTQAVEKIEYQAELMRRSEYGELWLERGERMENTLWREFVFADTAIGTRPEKPREEHRKANIRFDIQYQLVLCAVLNTNLARQKWDEPTFRYAAGNIVGELLFGRPSYARVFGYSRSDRVYIAAVVDASEHTYHRCERLAETCSKYLQCDMTVYMSAPCPITQICDQRLFWEQADINNVVRTVPVVENADQLMRQTQGIFLDTQALMELLRRGKPLETVNAMRKTLDAAERSGRISVRTLQSIRHDFTQVVFSYLSQEHILAHELFSEKGAKQLEAACENSVFDMLKWIDYVVKKGIDTVLQTRKSETVAEKIKRYIEENCSEEFSRETVGEYVYLSPGYAARIFKQETGKSMRDYANECRIGRAKQMLAAGGRSISEIAVAVGFDNFSYFSTLFKKYAGCSPSEFMRQDEASGV